MIRLDRVTKRFGATVAVDGLTLEIQHGELFAILGRNGAGKTTTIKMMAGLLRPDAGTVHVCGFDVHRQSLEAKSRLAYVPDQPFLYDKLSGREFLNFIAEMYRIENGRARAGRIDELSRLFELGGFLDELAEAYSHGMKQRLVLASALLHRPEVMVVDEPLVGLDPQNARLVKTIFREEARRGTTIFMSTHTLSVAEEVADRIGILHEGRLVELGTMAELRARSRSDGRLEDLFFRILEEQAGTNGDAAPRPPASAPPTPLAPPTP
jgi:ABC-2 type transport system ATP-binding protein